MHTPHAVAFCVPLRPRPLKNLPPAMACLHGALQEMVSWVDQIPPQTQSSVGIRFGNPSFKAWHERLTERSESIIATILYARDDADLTTEEACQRGREAAAGEPLPEGDSSVQQVSPYLHDSFGHAIRLDYGTGHESSFLVFLFILSKVKCMGALSMVTLKAVALSIVMLLPAILKIIAPSVLGLGSVLQGSGPVQAQVSKPKPGLVIVSPGFWQ